jgi:hypothetical protein
MYWSNTSGEKIGTTETSVFLALISKKIKLAKQRILIECVI